MALSARRSAAARFGAVSAAQPLSCTLTTWSRSAVAAPTPSRISSSCAARATGPRAPSWS